MAEGGLGSTAGSMLGGMVGGPVGAWLGSSVGGAAMDMLGGIGGALMGSRVIGQTMDDIKTSTEFNPWEGSVGGAGTMGPGGFQLNQNLQGSQNNLAAGQPWLMNGGYAGDASLNQGINSGGGIGGAMDYSNQMYGQQANPYYNQGQFANNMQNIGNVGNMFANNVQAGMQDGSGGQQQNLWNGGMQNIANASDQGALIQQNLDASRAYAAQGESDMMNDFANREFMNTRGATSGSERRQRGLMDAFAMADNQRIMNAQGLGLQASNQMGQLGLGMMGQGTSMYGANQNAYGQQMQGAGQFAQLGLQGEGQGYAQNMGALQQNQSGGQRRLDNAFNAFNMRTGAFNDSYNLGLGGIKGMTDIAGVGTDNTLGILNNEVGRIGAVGESNQALASLATPKAGFLSSIF